jgi:hypothetical protein
LQKIGMIIFAAVLALSSASSVAGGMLPRPLAMPSVLHALFGQNWYQVRVEQRVIIRIPRQRATPASMAGGNGRTPVRYNEQKIGKCILMDRLVASRPGPKESLELLTRDQQVIRAYLGDECFAREFYAGAYMERPLDGKLCVDRDLIHARTGAKCEVDKFRLLVPD